MAQHQPNWIYFVVIAVCLLITQSIAHLSTSETLTAKYLIYFLAFYAIFLQWIGFIHSAGYFGNERTEKYYDLTGSLTFLTTLPVSLYYVNGELSTRQIVISSFVAVWACRIGWYLYTRVINNNGIDSRFTLTKLSRPRFLMTWTVQGLWAFNTVVPVLIVNQSNKTVYFGIIEYIGILIWILGFLTEITADYQKITWQKIAKNKNKFINTGLWTVSRHPNYFGEISVWLGISLIAFRGAPSSVSLMVFWSPISVALILIFVSGIPLLEKKSNEKFGKDIAYQRYKKATPVLIPFFGRKGDAKF